MKKSKAKIAKEYCQAIYDEHGHITQELLVAYDKRHGKKLLTWDDKEAAQKFRIEEAAEWIANIALERQAGRSKRAYYNTVKVTESGTIRAYFPVEDIAADPQMYDSACQLFLSQIEGLTRQYSYLKEAGIIANAVEELKDG